MCWGRLSDQYEPLIDSQRSFIDSFWAHLKFDNLWPRMGYPQNTSTLFFLMTSDGQYAHFEPLFDSLRLLVTHF